METAVIVAIISGLFALGSATANYLVMLRNVDRTNTTLRDNSEQTNQNARMLEELRRENDEAKEERQRYREITRYSEPLARAAYDLQSRIYNIIQNGFIDVFLVKGNVRERSYAVDNTTFVIAQFLCWSELVRRDIQFIRLERDDLTLKLSHLQDSITWTWSTDGYAPCLRLFGGEQRAVGEALIRAGSEGPQGLGYGGFLKELPRGTHQLIDAIRDDVEVLAAGLHNARSRLIALQNALIDLLELLDPDRLRFPQQRRERLIYL
jgi:hypothetical protein